MRLRTTRVTTVVQVGEELGQLLVRLPHPVFAQVIGRLERTRAFTASLLVQRLTSGPPTRYPRMLSARHRHLHPMPPFHHRTSDAILIGARHTLRPTRHGPPRP